MSDLDLLREIGQNLHQPRFEEIRDTRRRRTRRTRAAAAAAAAAAVALVVAGTLLTTGRATRTGPPPVGPSPAPTSTPGLVTPSGQRTITSDVGRGDVHGYDVLATVTNTQPAHRGDAVLAATVPDTREAVSTYCRGGADLYYFYDIGDGGNGFGRCSPDADTALAPGYDLGDLVVEDPVGDPQTVRMWIARPSAAYLACTRSDAGDCNGVYGVPQPIASPDAEFGFRVFAHETTPAFPLLEDAGNGEPYPLEALSTVGGTAWLLDRAVVAASGAGRLAFGLPASDRGVLIDVYTGPGAHLERCRARHADELPDRVSTDHLVYDAAFDEACGVDVRLVVDGAAVDPDRDPHAQGHFTTLGAALSPGTEHQVVVDVVRGDPRDIRYAVVVRTRITLPEED